MFKKVFQIGLISGVTLTAGSYVFPDQFAPITKILNIGVAGVKVYWVYKYTSNPI
jgi:hypothetical protein